MRFFPISQIKPMPVDTMFNGPSECLHLLHPDVWQGGNAQFWEMAKADETSYRLGTPVVRRPTVFRKDSYVSKYTFDSNTFRISHELAHYVCAADTDILDPAWGIHIWTFLKDKPFTLENLHQEAEVLFVEQMLQFPGSYPSSDRCHRAVLGLYDFIESPKNMPAQEFHNERIELSKRLVDAFMEKWTPSKAMEEIERKDAVAIPLVAELTTPLQPRTSTWLPPGAEIKYATTTSSTT
jgi:hypothetical protein